MLLLSDATFGKGEPGVGNAAGGSGEPAPANRQNRAATTDGTETTPGETAKPAAAKTQLDHIALSLQRAYQSTLDEQVPDALLDLLRKLD